MERMNKMKVSIDDVMGFEAGCAITDMALNQITKGVMAGPFNIVKGIMTFNQWLHRLIYGDCKSIEAHWEMVWFQR